MSKIVELNKRKDEILARQEAIVNAALDGKRKPSDVENTEFETLTAEMKDINISTSRLEAVATERASIKTPTSKPVVADGKETKKLRAIGQPTVLSAEYHEQFFKNAGRWSRISNDMLFEGATDDSDTTSGGVVAPTIYEGQVITLAPNNLALRQLAFVTPTSNDIKIPVQSTRSVAAKKSQSTDPTSVSGTSFSKTNPTVKLVTLSADMLGNYVPVSLESLQDIGFMQAFVNNDISYAVLDAEEDAYTSVLLDATSGAEHFTGSLSAPEDYLDMTVQPDRYDAGSAWLMPKRKSISLRKEQVAANQFNPFWTVQNGREYFHGYPVYHSSKLESLGSPASDAVVFGNFNQGFIIGDRNNSAVLVKVDDITDFKAGIINIFGYRRSGSLVRDRRALRSSIVL